MNPKRVTTRHRRPGGKVPCGAVLVTRPSRWGNPHQWKDIGKPEAVRRFRRDLEGGNLRVSIEDVRRELKGKDLACYCGQDDSCHGNVLLEIANRKENQT